MIKKVKIRKRVKARDFLKFLTAKQKKILFKTTFALIGKRILHLNATNIGGGVAEILKSLIPYLRTLGIKVDWYVINPRVGKKFFNITNGLHNTFQGMPIKFTAKEWKFYEEVNKKIARDLERLNYDILIFHDPQVLYVDKYLIDSRRKIYISHLDTSLAYKKIWRKVLPVIKKYQRIVFSNRTFIHKGLPRNKIKIIPPAIDPLSYKQKIVPKNKAKEFLRQYGLSVENPLVVQVSRFDVWKNPLGVVNAFRSVQESFPQAQLALVGFKEARDNPEANIVYQDIVAIARKSPDIFIFFNPRDVNIPKFTMMAQNAADIIVQNSIKEGFGLTVAEAMWKGKAVIGGPAAGIRRQIKDGKNGYIAKNSEELAKRVIYLLKNHKKRNKLGKAAKKSVAKNFLFPRLVLDHLKLYKAVIKK